jgi:hypothetical protein
LDVVFGGLLLGDLINGGGEFEGVFVDGVEVVLQFAQLFFAEELLLAVFFLTLFHLVVGAQSFIGLYLEFV